MRRITSILRDLDKRRVFIQLSGIGGSSSRLADIDKTAADWQAKYDHLAGVPARSRDSG